MKFKVQSEDWTAALALVSSVTPAAVDAKGSAGYLCVVRGERCYLYSDDGKQRFRVPIPVFDVEGEGAFVFPTGQSGDLRYVEGAVEFEAGLVGGAHIVWCRRDSSEARRGSGVHKMVTFSPQALRALDADFGKAAKASSFPVALLREALLTTRAYLADPKESTRLEHLHVQVLGPDSESYDGFALGCSMVKTSLFYSDALQGKSLLVYGPRVQLLLSFLNKSVGVIDVFQSENSTYFMNAAEQVLGWTNQDFTGWKFTLYPLTSDHHILKMPRESLEKELRYVRSTLPADKNKAYLEYDHETSCLRISASSSLGGEIQSLPVPVTPLVEGDEKCWGPGDLGKTQSFEFGVNLDLVSQIVEATKHPRDVVLGIARAKKTGQYVLRIVESYCIDEQGKYVLEAEPDQKVFDCRAIRFVASKQ